MNALESGKWQNAYTEHKGFDDSLKRTGALLMPAIVILVIPLFYAIFYVFRVLSETPKEMIASRAQLIFYLTPGIILMLLALASSLLMLTFTRKHAGLFLQRFHNLPASINIRELTGLRIFGRVPLPPPFSKTIQFPLVSIKNGMIEPIENWHTNIGGPAKLQIDSGNAVYLERGDQFSRVVGQGFAFMELHERIKVVVNVGPQSRNFDFSAWTKDGICIDIKAKGEYFLGSSERNHQNENMLIPFDAEAVKKAVEQTLMGGKEGHEWVEGAIGKTKVELNDHVSNNRLEDIFKEDARLFAKSTMGDLLEKINQKLQGSGICLSHFQIIEAKTRDEITDKRMENWETAHKSHETIAESEIKAHRIRERERVRAEMQRNLIYTLASGLDRMDVEDFSEPLLLSVSALLDQNMNDPQVRSMLAKEALETLEKTQEAIKYNFQPPGEET